MSKRHTIANFPGTLLCIFATALLVLSCIHERILGEYPSGPSAPDPGTLILHFGIPGSGTATRTTEDTEEERQVSNIGVWAFEAKDGGDPVCVYYRYFSAGDAVPPQSDDEAGTPDGAFSLYLTDWPANVTGIVALANLPAPPVSGDQPGRALSELYGQMTGGVTPEAPLGTPLPMAYLYTGAPVPDGIHRAELNRSVARADIRVLVDDLLLARRLQLNRAQLLFTGMLSQSTMLSHPGFPPAVTFPTGIAPSFHTSHPLALVPAGADPDAPDAPVTRAVLPVRYLYQQVHRPADTWDPVGIVLQIPYTDAVTGAVVEDNYYRTAIVSRGDAVPADNLNDILPNRSYVMTLRIIGYGSDTSGFDTSVDCLPWSTEHEEMDAGLILSNTGYIHAADSFTGVTVARLLHAWTNTAPDYTTLCSAGVTFEGNDTSLPGQTGIRVTMSPGTDEGWIDITRLDQTTRISLRRAGPSRIATAGAPDIVLAGSYSLTPGYTLPSWLTLSERAGNTHLAFAANYSGGTGSLNRSETIKLAAGTAGGEIHLYAEQDGVALPAYANQITGGYAGTYHRHNERAERIIRMQNGDTGPWSASVIVGQDWIRLSPASSSDAGVSEGTTDTPVTGAALEASEYYFGNTGEAAGYLRLSGSGRDIRFRVGLTGTLSADTDARYGLVVVKHTAGKDHYILVRQGEGFETGKISPYNVKSPDDNYDTEGVNRPGMPGVFTAYPTQTGSYYRWNVQTNVRPDQEVVSPYGLDSGLGAADFDTTRDPCPAGYRTPPLDVFKYLAGPDFYTAGPNTGFVPDDTYRHQTGRNLHGKYADGWYDRHANPSADARGLEIAWNGMVMFRTDTWESLFLPFCGYRHFEAPNTGKRVMLGVRTVIWSADRNPVQGGPVDARTYYGFGFSIHHPSEPPTGVPSGAIAKDFVYIGSGSRTSYGQPIRCVKE